MDVLKVTLIKTKDHSGTEDEKNGNIIVSYISRYRFIDSNTTELQVQWRRGK